MESQRGMIARAVDMIFAEVEALEVCFPESARREGGAESGSGETYLRTFYIYIACVCARVHAYARARTHTHTHTHTHIIVSHTRVHRGRGGTTM